MFRLKLSFLLLLFGGLSLVAFSTPKDSSAALSKDTSYIEENDISTATIEKYLSDDDFVYDRVPPPAETFWEQFKRWLQKWFYKSFGENLPGWFWEVILWTLAVACLLFIIYKLFNHEIKSVFRGKAAANKSVIINEGEDIHEMDFNFLIQEAITKGDYKNAIRLSYLKLLKNLTDKDLISWKADKTNTEYLSELKKHELYAPFKKTTFIFEYVWYGDFKITKQHFDETLLVFQSMNAKINLQ